jgi:hypothetical protein
MSTDAAQPVRRLDIKLTGPAIGDDFYVNPVARLLIDGEDVLAPVGKWRYLGWPARLLLTDDMPLLPAEPPRPGRAAHAGGLARQARENTRRRESARSGSSARLHARGRRRQRC